MARLLLVDDPEHTLRPLALSLAVDDHALDVLDGDDAAAQLLARLDGPVPDVLVLCRDLPHTDGTQVLRDLRSRDDWSTVPVLLVSRQTSDEAMWEGWSAGASSYVAPPPEGGRLHELVVEQLVQQTFG